MRIERLDHVNLRTAQLEAMTAWYVDVLGLRAGPRPPFGFPGAWLYAGDAALVHLVGLEQGQAAGAGSEGPLKLEHFALSATGRSAFESNLTERGEPFETNALPGGAITQINVWDPDGNHIHVDFAD